ncbi:Na/Pi cotransporter family protein [bacterium]|nr:Na/Pi cotransporter family protein [bacterium]
MTFEMAFHIVFEVIGGLGLFLLGMKYLSEGMQAATGERLRKLLNSLTENRIIACGVGTSITALIQSSSVTTVMVVSMVNAGLITLRQAIGVIMGTNIGTTMTAWLVALNLVDYGLPILGVAVLVYLFAKSDRVQFIAMVFVGLGMIFFGLELMKTGLEPLKDLPEFMHLMAAFEPRTLFGLFKCILVGAGLTAIIQSSSATVALTITLAMTQAITFETAVALVLGENIGTTITAFLASLGTNTSARRAAYAHILFNIIGVTVMIPVFKFYVIFLNEVLHESLPIATRIAFSHSFFNLFVVLILLPLLGPYTRLVEILVPAKKVKEKSHLTYLDIRLYDTPALAIEQSHREIALMGENIHKMMDWLRTCIEDKNENRIIENKIFHREEIFDHIQKEIVLFIGKMLSGNLSVSVTTEARKQLRMADEYESISDYIVSILKMRCRLRNNELQFAPEGDREILVLHDTTAAFLDTISESVKIKNRDTMSKIQTLSRRLVHQIKDIRGEHLIRLEKQKTTPLASLIFLDMLNAYRRIQDHGLNIAEALTGEK